MDARSSILPTLAAAALACGAGCVSVPVGDSEYWSHEGTVVDSVSKVPTKTEVVAVSADCRKAPSGEVLRIGLTADVRDFHEKRLHDERVSAERQKRLAFGFFPARAEWWWRPDGSLAPTIPTTRQREGRYPRGATNGSFDWFLYPIVSVPAMLNSLLYDPLFGRWVVPERDWIDPGCLVDAGSGGDFTLVSTRNSEKLHALAQMPHDMRREIGSRTYLDSGWWPEEFRFSTLVANCGLFGFHRYATVSVYGPFTSNARTETEIRARSGIVVPGPLTVSVSIPDIGWNGTGMVPEGRSSASIPLPPVDRDLAVTAVVGISGAGDRAGPLTRDAAALALGTEWRFPIALKAPPHVGAPAAPIASSILTQVVVHVTEPAAASERRMAPWDIVTEEPFASGRATYLVTILDDAKTAFDVKREVQSEIERTLRDAFCAANPGVDENAVRAYVSSEFGANRTIRFSGVAFSVSPVADGWSYDADAHRGTVRLRVSAHMRPEDAQRWARENVSAIVSEKNVFLEAGRAPPQGATYRSLSESLADGVLVIEFEAEE